MKRDIAGEVHAKAVAERLIHPYIYDIMTDTFRPVTQEDVNKMLGWVGVMGNLVEEIRRLVAKERLVALVEQQCGKANSPTHVSSGEAPPS